MKNIQVQHIYRLRNFRCPKCLRTLVFPGLEGLILDYLCPVILSQVLSYQALVYLSFFFLNLLSDQFKFVLALFFLYT